MLHASDAILLVHHFFASKDVAVNRLVPRHLHLVITCYLDITYRFTHIGPFSRIQKDAYSLDIHPFNTVHIFQPYIVSDSWFSGPRESGGFTLPPTIQALYFKNDR